MYSVYRFQLNYYISLIKCTNKNDINTELDIIFTIQSFNYFLNEKDKKLIRFYTGNINCLLVPTIFLSIPIFE